MLKNTFITVKMTINVNYSFINDALDHNIINFIVLVHQFYFWYLQHQFSEIFVCSSKILTKSGHPMH